MKNIKNFFVSIFLVIAMPLSAALAQNSFPSAGNAGLGIAEGLAVLGETAWTDISIDGEISNNVTPPTNFTVTIPAAWQSQIVRVDYENESIFSLKTGNKTPAFLFSVTKITGDQWMKVKDQVKGYTIIENKDGFITFVQKTSVKKIKGAADAQYQEVLGQVDTMVASIRVK